MLYEANEMYTKIELLKQTSLIEIDYRDTVRNYFLLEHEYYVHKRRCFLYITLSTFRFVFYLLNPLSAK